MELKKAVSRFQEGQKETTRKSYEYPFRYFVAWMGEAKRVDIIKTADVLDYYHESLSKRGYAHSTLNKHIKTIKTFFNWLVDTEVIERSPARVLKVKRLPMYVDRDKAMTDEELTTLLDHILYHPRKDRLHRYRDYALVSFLADTGCRIGGAAGLQMKHLNLETRRARVTEKGEKSRPVRFGPETSAALARYLLIRPLSAGEYVFSTTQKPLIADNISLMIRRQCKQCGIRVLSGHSLRHRKGHQLADNHVAPTVAAAALGHADPVTWMQHYSPGDWATAEKELDKLVIQPDMLRSGEPKSVIDLTEVMRRGQA